MSAGIVSKEAILADLAANGGDITIPERLWKPKEASKNVTLGARFTKAERAAIECAAMRQQISPAAWLRDLALAALEQR